MTVDQRTSLTRVGQSRMKVRRGPNLGDQHRAHSSSRAEIADLDAWDPDCMVADVLAAERGVRLAYLTLGLAPPKIIWCRSPVEAAQQWSGAAADGRSGMSLKRVLFDHPFAEGMGRLASSAIGYAPRTRIRDRVTSAAIAAAALEAVGGRRPPLLSWIYRSRSHWPRTPRRPEFAAIGSGPDELNAASLLAYLQKAFDRKTCDALHAIRLVGENAGWLVPYERFCWLSERPDRAQTDAHGRLHSTSGPALHYRDGWSRYFWKGVRVPAWVITRPQDITLGWIDGQVDAPIRHAMIDIHTAERFIAEGGADPVQRDATATLWRRTWTHRGAVIDTWSAVEYAGAAWSPRMFHPVPACMRSPAEALSWLFGAQETLRHDVHH
jgi:hypothetical protein